MTEPIHNAGESGNSTTRKRRKPTSVYRKLRRKLSKTNLRIPHIWLRHHGFRPTDVFFGSYPRSGSTWARFTLFEILSGQESGFEAVNAGIAGVGRHATALPFLPGNGRLIASHEQYRKEYKRAVYMFRDARDVALSEFAYTRALEFFHGDLDEFLTTFLCRKISPFGPWQRHVTSWLDSPIGGTPDLLLVRYEEMRQNPVAAFARITEFLGVKADVSRIQRALANNSLEKMKEKELTEPQRASVKDRFVRSGSVQGWRSKLTSAQVQFIERHAGGVLQRLGYAIADASAEASFSNGSVLQTTAGFSSPTTR
jgi:sulfotransferase family protein